MLEYRVAAKRLDAHGSEARLILDTDMQGRADAFNPAEQFLASIAACMIKSIERVAPMIHFQSEGVEVKLYGVRHDAPPMIVSVDYEIILQTAEVDRRLELLHTNVRKYGTISNTVAKATRLEGTIRRLGSVGTGGSGSADGEVPFPYRLIRVRDPPMQTGGAIRPVAAGSNSAPGSSLSPQFFPLMNEALTTITSFSSSALQ